MYQGYEQKKAGEKALKEAEANKPTYSISPELLANLSDAERMQVEGLPAEQKKEFVQNIERSQQAAMKASADRKGGLLGLQQSMSQEAGAYSNLVSMDAAARKESELRKQAQIQQARGAIAGEKKFMYGEKRGEYQDQLTSAQANIGAGMQNINQGLQGLAGSSMQAATGMAGGAGAGAGTGTGARYAPDAANSISNIGIQNPGMIGYGITK